MGRTHGRAWAAAAFVALAAAGCTSGETATTTTTPAPVAVHPVAVAEEAIQSSGSALGPGIQVLEGSSLVGTVFPMVDLDAPQPDPEAIGWEALLVVDGDPIDVWNRYTSQLGIDEVASARKACIVERPPTKAGATDEPWDQRFLTEPVLEGEDRLECTVTTPDTSMAMVVGASCAPQPGASGSCDRVATAHLHVAVLDVPDPDAEVRVGADRLRASRAAAASDSGQVNELPPIPEGDVIAPVLTPTDLSSERPKVGQPIDGGLDPHLRRDDGTAPIAVLPEGASSLVAPALVLDCATGLVAVLDLPVPPPGAVATFDEADEFDDPATLQSGTDVLGRSWSSGRMTDGTYTVDVTAVETDSGRSQVLLKECGT